MSRLSSSRFLVLMSCALGMAWVAPAAIYIHPEIRQVPISRLIANLERQVESDPRNVQAHINLARLHGMAYALATEEVPAVVSRDTGAEQPWYGHEPDLIPYRAKPPSSPQREAAGREHLAKAIERYEAALALDPSNLLALIGYGWTLEQTSEKTRAIETYRQVIAQAWDVERKARRASLGQRFFTAEAAGYLIPLLDPARDAVEIAELRARREQLRSLPRPITPIAIPLLDNLPSSGVVDPLARVRFDADGSGERGEWSWIQPDAGWLVYDGYAGVPDDGTGKGGGIARPVTSALQLFGSVTFWLFWENGYEALSALDDDGDGELTGAELEHLAIWHDRDSNGRSDPGEVRSLATYGIVAISCASVPGDGTSFVAVSPRGVRFADGRTRPTYDVILRSTATILTRR